jgi:hypothetical protein
MNNRVQANIFVKDKISLTRKKFDDITGYFIYCYKQILHDHVKLSQTDCKQKTRLDFEFCLKENLVSYLQNPSNKIKCNIKNIITIDFQQETNKTYKQDGIKSVDEIDIFVSNLGLNSTWDSVNNENIYFAFECKRLKNTSKNNDYISDIEKFIQRDYWQTGFRFPFNGLIGFVEKSTISIEMIIDDIDIKLQKHPLIKSLHENGRIILKSNNQKFNYAKTSKHKHNSTPYIIEVVHLFFDYSEIIID